MTADTAQILAFFVVSAGIFFLIRLYPLWPHRDKGCDAYFFLSCARALRNKFRVPIQLPDKYLAEDQEQWYPPVFPCFLASLPSNWLRSNHWIINHLFDFVVAAALFYITLPFIGIAGAVILVVIYAMQHALLQEFQTLTSRPLGMLLQLLAIAATFGYVYEDSLAAGIIAIFVVASLVFTHKLSLQLLWFLFPFLSLTTVTWKWAAILISGYALAAIVWPSMFLKIQRAHFDIIRFWSQEWPLLGAHVVQGSPIYDTTQRSTAYYDNPQVNSTSGFIKLILQINIFAIFLALPLWSEIPKEPLERFFWLWALGIYLWVALTHFLQFLRGLGLAQQYVKFSYVPVFAFTAIQLSNGNLFSYIFAVGCAVMILRWYLLTSEKLRALPAISTSNDFTKLIKFLDRQVSARIIAFPYHLHDEIAYRSRAKVLWGTHGYGFDRVRPFFPVLREKLSSIVAKNDLTHVIIDTNYVNPNEIIGTSSSRNIRKFGDFLIVDTNIITDLKDSNASVNRGIES